MLPPIESQSYNISTGSSSSENDSESGCQCDVVEFASPSSSLSSTLSSTVDPMYSPVTHPTAFRVTICSFSLACLLFAFNFSLLL